MKIQREILTKLSDPNWDPLDEWSVLSHIKALREIIETTGEHPEGSTLVRPLKSRRRLLVLFSMSRRHVLEVGFNFGGSALLMLSLNPDLKVHSIDIGEHLYTKPAFEYLQSIFGERIKLTIQNSIDALPEILGKNPLEYDGFHIDGAHDFDTASHDLSSIIKLSKQGSTLVFDDSDMSELRSLLDFYIYAGKIAQIGDIYRMESGSAIFKIEK